jgi:hypothetical protein
MSSAPTPGRRPPGLAVESEQRFPLPGPVVPATPAGARRLGSAYWEEVERSTGRAIRVRDDAGVLELRLLGRGPALLRFGPPQARATASSVSCAFPILGGLLARAEGGSLVFVQEAGEAWFLRSSLHGFLPRLGASPGRPRWTGILYLHVQARLHRAIGRRYAARLVRESGR